jgi:hypothetical protein
MSIFGAGADIMLPPAKEDLVRRRWIWQALSDLFLDEDLTEDTLRYIARIAGECGYADEELEAIYRREVAPAVAFNCFSPAGTWGYFDTVWLEKQILRSRGLGYWFDRLVIAPLPVWPLRHVWRRFKRMLAEQRELVREEQQKQGSQWRPCWAKEAPCLLWASDEPGATSERSGR